MARNGASTGTHRSTAERTEGKPTACGAARGAGPTAANKIGRDQRTSHNRGIGQGFRQVETKASAKFAI